MKRALTEGGRDTWRYLMKGENRTGPRTDA